MTEKPLGIIIALLAIVLLALLGMTVTPTPTPTPTPDYVTVSGTVTVPDGMSVESVTIQLIDESGAIVGSAVTGTDGTFQITSANATAGTYTITAAKGDAAGSVQVGLGLGDNVGIVLSLVRGSAGMDYYKDKGV